MARFNFTVYGPVTTTTVSSFSTTALRSATVFDVEETRLERREVILIGTPIVLVVLAISVVFCILLLRWKIRDRHRQSDLTTQSQQQQPYAEGKHGSPSNAADDQEILPTGIVGLSKVSWMTRSAPT